MRRLRDKLTYANVMATIAVFIALGGASYAATQLPKNSVGTKQLKKNAVTTTKIQNGAVTGEKIALSSVGTVPSATHADTATSADTAVNSSQLGGSSPSTYLDKCPTRPSSGETVTMTLVAPGLCMTEERGANTFTGALKECGEVGLRLPSPGEAQLMFSKATPEQPFWTDDFWVNGSTSTALVYWPKEENLYAMESSSVEWIFCVTTPTNS